MNTAMTNSLLSVRVRNGDKYIRGRQKNLPDWREEGNYQTRRILTF